MTRAPQSRSRLTRIALAFAGALGVAVPAQSGFINIANEPLGAPAASVLPNMMFILDDSGSMGFDYMPEYLNDGNDLPANNTDRSFSTAACADSSDSGGTITGPPSACLFGDPPYNSPQFNEIYYNPETYYQPGISSPDSVTGVQLELQSQNEAATTSWTQVKNNAYDSLSGTTNLVTQFPDRVWCKAFGSAVNGPDCKKNTGYEYPNVDYPHGRVSAGGDPKMVNGPPYYYTMQTAQYCTTETRDVCASGNAITPGVHTFQAPEFCNDTELTDCKVGAALAAARLADATSYQRHGVRWCKDDGTFLQCRRRKGIEPSAVMPGTYDYYIFAKHVGVVKTVDCAATPAICQAAPNLGNIIVRGVAAGGGTITDIRIGGTSVISPGGIAVPAGTSRKGVADLIAARINAFLPTLAADPNNPPYDYTAVSTSAAGCTTCIVALTQATPAPGGIPGGAAGVNAQVVIVSNQVGTQASWGSIKLSTNPTPSTADPVEVSSVTVNAVNLFCGTSFSGGNVTADGGGSFGNGVYIRGGGSGNVVAPSGTNSISKRTSVRRAMAHAISQCAVNGFSATDNSGTGELIIKAPTALGLIPNGQAVGRSGTGVLGNFAVAVMGTNQTGQSTGDVLTSVNAMTGGRDANSAPSFPLRVGVGAFGRTDIISGRNYPRGAKRTDCVGAECTYAEEMTNVANWWAYYRTRMQMMKTAVGRAFAPIDSNYRVGFITICPVTGPGSGGGCTNASTSGLDVVPSKYLKIAVYNTAHKKAWYDKLYATRSLGQTPLREALARVGQIYAGNFGSGLTKNIPAADDPMTRSCQPSFALLSTDGFWNGQGGVQIDGTTAMGNQDNANVGPYSLQSQGVFDGENSFVDVSGNTVYATNTLADVALYYYTTDLRTAGPYAQNNVPPSGKDTNQAQHMVTFTIGLGLEGELNFRQDYETAGSGDFFDIRQGTKKWPVPVSGEPSTLDDLWHAAVNGRGVFYSIRNPVELAAGLADMRAQLAARLGAGAAAATSNLQPVAGDNFAFTASFTTSSWIGDLKARTIDLTTGVVSAVNLWSAAALLDPRPYTDRRIYTLDTSNTVGSGGQNNNNLKNFCPPGGGTGCADGAGLTASPGEMASFVATALPQSFDATQQTNATPASLVNYLRGDKSYENSTPFRLAGTDLYRARESALGDIINAQPAYVKRALFAYADPGYLGFRACTEGVGVSCDPAQFPAPAQPRRGTVYAAGNDGMLHAFETDVNNNPYFQTAGISSESPGDDVFTGDNAGNGAERWAYIPRLVLPNIYQLASDPYTHSFFTDGSPRYGDICISTPCGGQNDWRSILVAGLNSGGKGYYALDITNPMEPKAMWEVSQSATCLAVNAQGVPTAPGPHTSDCHFGLTYGDPIITKRFHDQKWVVIVTSGYHRNAADLGASDGRGYLYVLDATNGNILHRLNTTAGTAASPSGLAKIAGWATNGAVDNTVLAVYGGDLEGNLWRFKLDFTAAGTPSVTKVATVMSPAIPGGPGTPPVPPPIASAAQPITVRPELGEYQGERIIAFGTGKFLEVADKIGPFQTQTIYALRDDLGELGAGPVIPDVRDATKVKVRTFAPGKLADTRTVADITDTSKAPNLKIDSGWLIDLPESGERVNIDPILQLGTLVVASNVPIADTCSAGGFAFVNFLDLATGGYVPGSTNNLASSKIGTSLLVGINVIMLPGGAVKTLATQADAKVSPVDTPVPPPVFIGRRVSWRELFIE